MDKTEYELLNRIDDYIDHAIYKNLISVTRFLNPYEQSTVINKLKNIKDIKYEIYGGYKYSERNVIAISPDNASASPENYLALVKINFTKFDTKYINHRMILGSVLALGITRDGIGDIILDSENNTAYVIATKKMAEYIYDHLIKVGGANVSALYIEDTSSAKLTLKEPFYVNGTVSSLRIDSILALALKTSRTKAVELIKDQRVYINWQLVLKPTHIVKEGQIITVRKKGRIMLTNILGSTKKDRMRVELQVTI